MIKGAKEDRRGVVNRASLDISDAFREQEYITDIFYGQQSMIHKERGFCISLIYINGKEKARDIAGLLVSDPYPVFSSVLNHDADDDKVVCL